MWVRFLHAGPIGVNMSDGGKGSKQRPTNKEQFDKNWNKIFNKAKTEQEKFDEQVIMKAEYYDLFDEEPKRV